MSLIKQIGCIKESNKGKICLFRQGIFYYVIGTDACLLSDKLGLKKLCYSKGVCKVGIPFLKINRYTKIFESYKFNYCIYDYTKSLDYEFSYNDKKYIKTKEYTKGKKIKDLDMYNMDCENCNVYKENVLKRQKIV